MIFKYVKTQSELNLDSKSSKEKSSLDVESDSSCDLIYLPWQKLTLFWLQ